jgi:hypothetical protein
MVYRNRHSFATMELIDFTIALILRKNNNYATAPDQASFVVKL